LGENTVVVNTWSVNPYYFLRESEVKTLTKFIKISKNIVFLCNYYHLTNGTYIIYIYIYLLHLAEFLTVFDVNIDDCMVMAMWKWALPHCLLGVAFMKCSRICYPHLVLLCNFWIDLVCLISRVPVFVEDDVM